MRHIIIHENRQATVDFIFPLIENYQRPWDRRTTEATSHFLVLTFHCPPSLIIPLFTQLGMIQGAAERFFTTFIRVYKMATPAIWGIDYEAMAEGWAGDLDGTCEGAWHGLALKAY